MLGTPHAVAFRLRPGDGQGPRAYLDRQPYFQQMPRLLVVETAIHWIDTFRFLMGEVAAVYARLRRVNPAIAGEDAGYIVFEFAERRDRPLRRQPPQRPRRRRIRAARWARCGSRARPACCASTATRGCGGSRISSRRREHAYDRGPDDTFGGGACEWLQRHVVAHFASGAPLENTARDYLANLRVQEAVYRSAAEGRASSLPRSTPCTGSRSGAGAASQRDRNQGGSPMKRRPFVQHIAAAAAVAAALALAPVAAGADRTQVQPHRPARRRAAEGRRAFRARRSSSTRRDATRCRSIRPGQLANDPKGIEQLQLGGIDFTVSGTGSYATHIPTLNLTALPFIVETYQQGWKLYDESKWMQAQFAKGPEKGFRFLSTFEAGFRSMTTKDPLNTPADAKGKKLRSFPNEMMRWQLEAMGFNVQIMPLPEVYLAIQQGTVSGPGKPDRHDLREQVLRSRAERDADAARLQPDPADDFGEDLAEALAGGSRGGDQGGEGSGGLEPQGGQRQRRPPARRKWKARAPRSRGRTSGRGATR